MKKAIRSYSAEQPNSSGHSKIFRLSLLLLLAIAGGTALIPVWLPVHAHIHPVLAARLFLNGKGVDDLDIRDYSSLQVAAEHGCADCVRLLLKAGADVEKQLKPSSRTGYRPLHLAAIKGSVDVVHLLASAGANLNSTDSSGCTPLFWAVRHGHEGLVGHLLKLGADPNFRSTWSWRPLHWAALMGKELAVQELIDAGAAINERVCANITVLKYPRPKSGAIGRIEIQTWPDSLGTTTPISWESEIDNPCNHPDPLGPTATREENETPRLYTPLALSKVFKYDAVTALLQLKGGVE